MASRKSNRGGSAFFKGRSLFILLALVAGSVVFGFRFASNTETPAAADTLGLPRTEGVFQPLTLSALLSLDSKEISKVDIAIFNLLCAEGLSGAESLNVADSLNRLDGIAKRVERETQRHFYRYKKNPAEFEHSPGYFRMLLMAVVLQQDLGMRYNPERITEVGVFEPNSVFFADSRDVFIHGLIADDRRMGTCSSMPVLYVAIGRRLGYPLKLVPTKNHLFVRWEDEQERFNVDATGRGMNRYDDDHYRRWPYPVSPQEESEFGYLRSFSPVEELAEFLTLRAASLMAMGRFEEAVATHEAALRLTPESRLHQLILADARQEAAARLRANDPLQHLPPEYTLRRLGPPNQKRPALIPYGSGVRSPIPEDPDPLRKIRPF